MVREYKIEMGPLTNKYRAAWIEGDVKHIKKGVLLITPDGISVEILGTGTLRPKTPETLRMLENGIPVTVAPDTDATITTLFFQN